MFLRPQADGVSPENEYSSRKSQLYTLIVAFFSRIVVFLGPAPGAKKWSGIFFSPFLQNFESRSGKKRNAFWPVGFFSIFVVRERPQASSENGLRGRANCLKQLVLEKERDTQMEAFFSGIRIAEICSVKIARPPPAGIKIREIVAKKMCGTVWRLGVG